MIPLPEPSLRSTETGLALTLRPWVHDDAPALVAAWADPEIQRWTAVPERRDLVAAERWIAGDAARREQWSSLDLVVEWEGAVAGEVGLSAFDRESGTADIGWWTAPEHRRRGIASTAATLVVAWATGPLGLTRVVARCEVDNPASVVVGRRSGAMVLV